MLRPTPEELTLLRPMERFGFWLGDIASRYFKWAVGIWESTTLTAIAWLCIGRRVRVFGLDDGPISRDGRFIAVANHRSFFDFFVVRAILRWSPVCPRRAFFPVRSNFFYTSPLGVFINMNLSGMSMFPPILRDPERGAWNKYALARANAELQKPGTLLGMHPEGTRNKGPDPYRFLPAQPGIGRVVLEASPEVQVVPIFVLGMSNSLGKELIRNWRRPAEHPIYVWFGEAVDFGDLRAAGNRPTTQKRASDRCLEAIARLGEEVRKLEPQPQPVNAPQTETAARATG